MAHVAFDSWLNAAMIVASREAMLNQADYLAEGASAKFLGKPWNSLAILQPTPNLTPR
jgi:hypothetical protein